MAGKKRVGGPAVLTANAILTGAVVFWTGAGWSPDIADATRADEHARTGLEDTGRAEEAGNRVVGAYLMTLDAFTGDPVELRERRRLAGPSIALPVAATAA